MSGRVVGVSAKRVRLAREAESPGELFVPRGLLAGAAALSRYPPARLGSTTFTGREVWGHVLRRAVPSERWALLQGLEDHLLAALPVGRARLAEGTCHHDADPRPYVYGDKWLLPLLREALAFMPAAVRSVASREAAWLGVGRESVAWTCSSLLIGEDGATKPRIVNCGPATTVKTLLHEAVHVWFSDIHSEVAAVSIDGSEALASLAEAEGWADRIDDNQAMHELLAEALSLVWLWRTPPGKPA